MEPDATMRRAPAWTAPAVAIAIAVASFGTFQLARPAIADLVGPLYGASLVLSAGFVYPWSRRRGLQPAGAAAAGLAVPLLWVAKECWAVGRVFSIAEALYYAFNPLALGVLVAAALQMAVAELWLRRSATGRWQIANGAGLTIAVIAILAGAYGVVAARSDPTRIFWAYIALYRWLFD
jgi:hypothetical protein